MKHPEGKVAVHLLMVEKLTTMSAIKRPTMPNTPPLAPTNARQVSSNAALKKLPAAARASIFAWGTLPDADLLHVSQNSSWKRRCVGQGRQQFGYVHDFGRGRWMDWHLQQQKRARRPQSCRIRTSLPSVASHARSTKLLVACLGIC